MLYEINVIDALNLQIAENDGYTLKRVNRRKLDDDKDSAKDNSCFRKGYHKYEKQWKQETRRNRRHADRAELRRQPRVSEEALKDWAMNRVFYDGYFRREAFGAVVTPHYTKWGRLGKYNRIVDGFEIWVGIDEYDVTIGYDDFVDEDLVEYGETFFLTVEEAINLGLVE